VKKKNAKAFNLISNRDNLMAVFTGRSVTGIFITPQRVIRHRPEQAFLDL
jgi:hypothetical protein